jgi:hypothetical protein
LLGLTSLGTGCRHNPFAVAVAFAVAVVVAVVVAVAVAVVVAVAFAFEFAFDIVLALVFDIVHLSLPILLTSEALCEGGTFFGHTLQNREEESFCRH